jgi:alcohol dehydrogenase class IV
MVQNRIMEWEFATATRIIFGPGRSAELPQIAREFGRRALLVTGRTTGRAKPLHENLGRHGIDAAFFPMEGEPTLDLVRRGVQACREGCEFVISFGGGSVIDAGKAIAALAPNSGEPLDYLEVIGRGQPFERSPLPFIAVPTTAGTGSEVTRNAVLGSPENRMKASLRSPLLLAKVALIDPDLTLDLPREITANTGLDALTQVIEPFVSARANPFTDTFCLEGLKRIAACLRVACEDGSNRQAREAMSFASLMGGLSLANAALGVVHGFAAPLGGMLHAPHGALCAAVLPHGIGGNIRALRKRAPDHVALRKYEEIARVLSGNPNASAENAACWTAALCSQLGIPPLRKYGLRRDQIPNLVEKAQKASSMKGNPIPLTAAELTEIAQQSW